MVSVSAVRDGDEQLTQGLNAVDSARLLAAIEFVRPVYEGKLVPTGQEAMAFSKSVVASLAALKTDIDTRIAGMLFELAALDPKTAALIETRFGKEVADMVTGIRQLMRLHEGNFVQPEQEKSKDRGKAQATGQLETLRKMTLAMATDMRVVLVRLTSRLATRL